MTEEARRIERKTAYIDTVRGLYRRERDAGFVACLAGVMLLVWARFGAGAPAAVMWVALAVIGSGWALFAYALARRIAWVRAHPLEDGD